MSALRFKAIKRFLAASVVVELLRGPKLGLVLEELAYFRISVVVKRLTILLRAAGFALLNGRY